MENLQQVSRFQNPDQCLKIPYWGIFCEILFICLLIEITKNEQVKLSRKEKKVSLKNLL